MSNIKFYSPVDVDDTSSGLTVAGDLTVDTNVLHVDTTNNRVGIGTTSPTAKLTVSDTYTTRFTGNDILFDRAGPAYINATNASGKLGLQTGGNTRMYINESGNIGVGTTSPDTLFHVSGNTKSTNYYVVNGSIINASDTDTYMQFLSPNIIRLVTGGNERLRVVDSGNVLIGTTTDSGYKLDVAGNVIARNTYPSIYVDHSGTTLGGIRADATNKLELKTLTTAPLSFQVNSSEKMRVTSSGNVGIGTSSPSTLLHLAGSTAVATIQDNNSTGNTASAKILFTDNGTFGTIGTVGFDGNDVLQITNSHTGKILLSSTVEVGKVTVNQTVDNDGIRVYGYDDKSASLAKLYVDSAGNTKLTASNSGTSAYLEIKSDNYVQLTAPSLIYTTSQFRFYDAAQLDFGSGGDYKIKYDSTNDILNIHTDTNEGITIGSTGNVLIGTTTDNGYKLQVNGDATINSHWVGRGPGSVSTNVVLGQYNLNNNVSGGSNTAIGYSALSYNTGNNNTAVGREAGYANTTGSIVAVGYQAGYSNTTGGEVTALGHQALRQTTGGANTAIGYQAAYNTTSSTSNTAIGRTTLLNNTTGSNNTAVGRDALRSSTTSSNNTAVGRDAGYNNTTGNITAFGYAAGYSNTTGTEITAIGREALKNSTGTGHTIVGYNSALSTTTGTNNSTLGAYALRLNNTGSNNVAIGKNSGYNNTSGSNNIFIGKDSDGVAATDSNRTFIGNSSTTSTWVGGNLLVGTTTDNGSGLRVFSTGNGELEVERSGGAQINLQAQSARGVIGTDSNHELQLKTNSTARVWITTGGNVGIGTSPGALFHVNKGTVGEISRFGAGNYQVTLGVSTTYGEIQAVEQGVAYRNLLLNRLGGNILIGTTTDSGQKLQVSGSVLASDYIGSTHIYLSSPDSWIFRSTGGTERMRLTSSGNVGIGTTSPSAKLDIVGDGADFFLQSNDFKIARIQPRGTGVDLDKGLFSLFDGSAEDVRIDTAGSSWFNGGNVGIGTSSPTSKTHVYYGGGTTNGLHVQASANRGKIAVSDNDTAAYMIAENSLASFGRQDALSSNNLNITNGGNVLIGTTTDAGATVHIRQSSSGQSPINSPSLFIENNGTSNSYYALQVATAGGGHSFNVTNAGNVGIGTSSPQAKMQISSGNNTATQMLIGEGSTYGAPSIRFAIASTNYMGIGFTTGSVIGNEVLDAISIQRTGNIGISNTSPNYNLDVTGDINATSNYYHNGVQGYTGTVTIQQPAPQPPINIDINGGIITNVY